MIIKIYLSLITVISATYSDEFIVPNLIPSDDYSWTIVDHQSEYPMSDILSESSDQDSSSNTCSSYLPIQDCYNFDTEITVCYWDETLTNCPLHSSYKLYFTKRSDKLHRVYTCSNEYSAKNYYDSLDKDILDQLPSTSLKNFCILGGYDSKNVGATYDFYVGRSEGFVAVPPKDANLIFPIEGFERLQVTQKPENLKLKIHESDDISSNNLNSIRVTWEPPKNLLYDYGQIELDYQVSFRKVLNKIHLAEKLVSTGIDVESLGRQWDTEIIRFGEMSVVLGDLDFGASYEVKVACRAKGSELNVWGQETKSREIYVSGIIDDYDEEHVLLPTKFQSKHINDNNEINKIISFTTEKEQKFTPIVIFLFSILGLLSAIIFALLAYILKNRQKLKERVIVDVPKANIKVKLGREDAVLNRTFNGYAGNSTFRKHGDGDYAYPRSAQNLNLLTGSRDFLSSTNKNSRICNTNANTIDRLDQAKSSNLKLLLCDSTRTETTSQESNWDQITGPVRVTSSSLASNAPLGIGNNHSLPSKPILTKVPNNINNFHNQSITNTEYYAMDLSSVSNADSSRITNLLPFMTNSKQPNLQRVSAFSQPVIPNMSHFSTVPEISLSGSTSYKPDTVEKMVEDYVCQKELVQQNLKPVMEDYIDNFFC